MRAITQLVSQARARAQGCPDRQDLMGCVLASGGAPPGSGGGWGLWLNPACLSSGSRTTPPSSAGPLGCVSVLGAVVLLPTASVSLPGEISGLGGGGGPALFHSHVSAHSDPPHQPGSETRGEQAGFGKVEDAGVRGQNCNTAIWAGSGRGSPTQYPCIHASPPT